MRLNAFVMYARPKGPSLTVDSGVLERLGARRREVEVGSRLDLPLKFVEDGLVEPGRATIYVPTTWGSRALARVLGVVRRMEAVGYEVHVLVGTEGGSERLLEGFPGEVRVENVKRDISGILELSDDIFELFWSEGSLLLDLGWARDPGPRSDLAILTVSALVALKVVENTSGERPLERTAMVMEVDRRLVDASELLHALMVALDLAYFPIAPDLGRTVREGIEELLEGLEGSEREELRKAADAFERLSGSVLDAFELGRVEIPDRPGILRELLEYRLRGISPTMIDGEFPRRAKRMLKKVRRRLKRGDGRPDDTSSERPKRPKI